MNPTFNYKKAMIREVPRSFTDCLKQEISDLPISFDTSRQQHHEYAELLESLGLQVIRLPAIEKYPDCCFVEDTAVVIGQRAAISFLGAQARVGEEVSVAKELSQLGLQTTHITSPGTIDGGDVLFTGPHLFVGLSQRSNAEGARQLSQIFNNLTLITIPVSGTLHLKSVMSAFDQKTLIFSQSDAAQSILAQLKLKLDLERYYEVIIVPDQEAANVLSINSTVVMQKGFPESELILKKLAEKRGVRLVSIQMSEFFKADGALTCCNILFN